jgi:formate hydrogenlyase transcriptional activator
MTPDPDRNYRSLLRLCQAIRAGEDPRALFLDTAEAVRELTGCQQVGLLPAPGATLGPAGLAVDWPGPRCSDLPRADEDAPAVAWVLQHRQPRATPADEDGRAFLYLPLVCRAQAVGVLRLTARGRDALAGWDLQTLAGLGDLLALALDNLAAADRVAELQRFQRENVYLRDELKTDRDLRLLTGESRAMKAVRLAIQQVARTDSTVLILGETGTGKELVARAIHQLSPRRAGLLVAVNCAALAPGVIGSELFGHEQGAFTGATKRRLGRFELAHRGTLFLDEVGELPPETQVLLLRALQERTIERVGGHEPIPVDVRVIAATHRDLEGMLAEGRFRDDLYFRLNVFPIRVPPLRERREDIPDLVRHFLLRFGQRLNRAVARVSPATLELLTGYHWPGNVRELENLVERALIVITGEVLEVDPNWLRPRAPGNPAGDAHAGLAGVERRTILEALERSGGKIYGPGGAAAALGLKPTTLYGKMRKLGIAKGQPRE